MKGINVDSAQALERGFEYDRRWVIVDQEGKFLSQRSHPQMALYETSFKGRMLVVNHKGSQLEFGLQDHSGIRRFVTIWDLATYGFEVSTVASKWFSDQLGTECYLVKMTAADDRIKPLNTKELHTKVSFADGYPYLIVGTASMDLLSDKLGNPIQYNRFRPNIVITTKVPHEEDNWLDININNVILKGIKPCARCQVITIDQSTGEKGKEPLKTLATYRVTDRKINFGANVICKQEGIVKVHQKVEVTLK